MGRSPILGELWTGAGVAAHVRRLALVRRPRDGAHGAGYIRCLTLLVRYDSPEGGSRRIGKPSGTIVGLRLSLRPGWRCGESHLMATTK
jgi:hypothetical protein